MMYWGIGALAMTSLMVAAAMLRVRRTLHTRRNANRGLTLEQAMGPSLNEAPLVAFLGDSITEGIGQGRITANLDGFTPDVCYKLPDTEALPIVFDLLADEGLCLGGSSGINIAGAMRMAKEMGPGHTIVTILCDYGTRYQSKLFNPEFLRGKGLPVPPWMDRPARDVPTVFMDPE